MIWRDREREREEGNKEDSKFGCLIQGLTSAGFELANGTLSQAEPGLTLYTLSSKKGLIESSRLPRRRDVLFSSIKQVFASGRRLRRQRSL